MAFSDLFPFMDQNAKIRKICQIALSNKYDIKEREKSLSQLIDF